MISSADLNALLQAKYQKEHLDLLFHLLRQPSVSTTGEGVEDCARLVHQLMTEVGLQAELQPTGGWPVVYGEWIAGSEDPTILIYGHYDVQPVGDLGLWTTPPFEPAIRDGRIYARGSADNKGQFLAHLLAIKILREQGALPRLNIKVLIEGEEEMASVHLPEYISSHREQLAADLVFSSDGPRHSSDRATVFLGCRGNLHIELKATGANRDLHSGHFGGLAPNPAIDLTRLIASILDSQGRVMVDGFYDSVRQPTEKEEQVLGEIPLDLGEYFGQIGLDWDGEVDPASFYKRLMFQPNFNIAGFNSGYDGPGMKTIIPKTAVAKIDIRLVTDQDPEDIFRLIRAHVEHHAPGVQIRPLGKVPPSRTSVETPVVRTILEAVRSAAGEPPVLLLSMGGTVPDYLFTSTLNLPSIWVPYANADNANHAPNENLRVDCFFQGIAISASVLQAIAQQPNSWRLQEVDRLKP